MHITLVKQILDTLNLPNRMDEQACLFFLEEMLRWNKTHGLTAVTNFQEMLVKHVADSLAIYPWINGTRWVDVGTGGGLPGIPLALLFPEKHFTLVESQHKKGAFLGHMKRALNLSNVEVVKMRSEAFKPDVPFDGVVTRAFSSLKMMLDVTKHLCKPEGIFVAMKGVYPEAELLAIAAEPFDADVKVVHVPGLEAARHCVILKRNL